MDCTSVLDFDSQTYRKLWILSGYSCYETNYYVDVEAPGDVELSRVGNLILQEILQYENIQRAFMLLF
jgi:hypothetical protein